MSPVGKIAIGCCLLVASICLSAQPFKKGNFVIGGMYQTHLLGKSQSFEKAYGIHASYFIDDRWSLEYSLAYVNVPFQTGYFKVYGGAALAGYGTVLATNSLTTDGYWALVVFSCLVPEGVSYHIPVNNQVTISPYINLLTVDLSNQYLRMTNTVGARFNLVISKAINISPYACTMLQYRGKSAGGTVGGFGAGVMGRWVF